MSKALELGLISTAPRRRRRWRWPFLFLLTLPTLLVVLVVFGIPLAYSLNLSLHRINMLTRREVWVGLQNYRTMLSADPAFWISVKNTASYTLLAVPLGLAGSLALALLLSLQLFRIQSPTRLPVQDVGPHFRMLGGHLRRRAFALPRRRADDSPIHRGLREN